MNMDHELRDALRRKQAPDDLADRVLARINAGATNPRPGSTGSTAFGSSNVRRWLAAAAVVAVAAGGAERYYTQQQQAAEADRVKGEIRLALEITNDTLARVQSKLSQPVNTKAGKGNP
jgi:anti-sigma-K factor RskA